ncbi:MAG: hypothetical protein IPL46_25365 [Saprospiraceae bacterium]|nr:hypothetical protein [Saprospiraceae bacterium]
MKFIICLLFLLNLVCLPCQSQVSEPTQKNNQFITLEAILPSLYRPSVLYLPLKRNHQSILTQQAPDLNNLQVPTAFFCRIEDAIAKSSGVNMKFRLGSVQYVDALEGKGYFEALSYSKATNFYLSRKN